MKVLNHIECIAVSGAGNTPGEYAMIGGFTGAILAEFLNIFGAYSVARFQFPLVGAIYAYSFGYAINYGPLGDLTLPYSQKDITSVGVVLPACVLALVTLWI